MDKFPLLCLPFIAIQEVFSTWTPFDIINFSLISSKTKMIAKVITKVAKHRKRYVIRSTIHEYPDLTIFESETEFWFAMTPSENEKFINNSDKLQIIKKYSEDVLESYKKWVECVLEALNCEIQEIEIRADAFPDKNEEIIDWWKSQSNSINYCDILRGHESEETDDVIVTYLLNNLKLSGYLNLEVKLSENFQATIPNVLDRLEIHYGKWFTVQRLLKCDCPLVFIIRSGLTNQEVNQFLKSWQSSESNFNLIFLYIEIQNDIVLEEGLNIQAADDYFRITRIDRKVAELKIGNREFRFSVKQL